MVDAGKRAVVLVIKFISASCPASTRWSTRWNGAPPSGYPSHEANQGRACLASGIQTPCVGWGDATG